MGAGGLACAEPADGAPCPALTPRCGPHLGSQEGWEILGGRLCGVTSPCNSAYEGTKPSVLGQDQESPEGAPASHHRTGTPRQSPQALCTREGPGSLGPDSSVAISSLSPLGVSYLGWPSVPAHADGGWTRRQQSSALAAAEYTRRRDMAGLGGGSSQVFPPLWGLRDPAGTGRPSLCSEQVACWSCKGWRCPPHTPARHAG